MTYAFDEKQLQIAYKKNLFFYFVFFFQNKFTKTCENQNEWLFY